MRRMGEAIAVASVQPSAFSKSPFSKGGLRFAGWVQK